jgi:hypothetical protein
MLCQSSCGRLRLVLPTEASQQMALHVKGHVALILLRRALRTVLSFYDVLYFIAAFNRP